MTNTPNGVTCLADWDREFYLLDQVPPEVKHFIIYDASANWNVESIYQQMQLYPEYSPQKVIELMRRMENSS